MRFPVAALMFIVTAFIFFVCFAVSSLLIGETHDALDPYVDDVTMEKGKLSYLHDLIPTAFGVIGAIFFVTGILLIFVFSSLAEEPELYYRRYK